MIAVVIPYYKPDFFNQTLYSLSVQTDKRFHVYIGNDCSPSSPTTILEKYKNSFRLNYFEFETNLGGKSLVKQWQRCIDTIQDEEWMMILGDDDTLSENCIADFYNNLEEINNRQANVVRFATQIINKEDEIISGIYEHPKIESSIEFLFRKLKGGSRSSLSEYIFKTEKVNQYKFKEFPLAWHSDDLAILEFSEFGTVFTINTSIVNFRWSGKNITSFTHDMVIKNKATFSFYYYLLSSKKENFNREQQEILYHKLEKSFLNDKKNSYFWLKLMRLYLGNLKYKSLTSLLFKAFLQGVRYNHNH